MHIMYIDDDEQHNNNNKTNYIIFIVVVKSKIELKYNIDRLIIFINLFVAFAVDDDDDDDDDDENYVFSTKYVRFQ